MKKYKTKSYIIYKITDNRNGKIYIGLHETYNINDNYMGSGKLIKEEIQKVKSQGLNISDIFKKEILFIFDNRKDMLAKELDLVNEQFIKDNNTYNLVLGGQYSQFTNNVSVKTDDGIILIPKTEYDTKDYKHINTGYATVKNSFGEISRIKIDDPRYNKELLPVAKGYVTVKDKENSCFNVKVDDPRLKTGELQYITKGKVIVRDKENNTFQISVNDPRYINGELSHITKGYVIVKDKENNTFNVKVDDPRYINGELVHACKGLKPIINWKDKKVKFVKEEELEFWESNGWTRGFKIDFDRYDSNGNEIPDEKFRIYWEEYKNSNYSLKNIAKKYNISYFTLRRRIAIYKKYYGDNT